MKSNPVKTGTFRIENGLVELVLEASPNGIRSLSIRNRITGTEYLHRPVNEFMFSANQRQICSFRESGTREVDGNRDISGCDVQFSSATLLESKKRWTWL